MSGNVNEWIRRSDDGDLVMRGGCYTYFTPEFFEVTNSFDVNSSNRSTNRGFRLVQDLD
jgi:hypothetical protein